MPSGFDSRNMVTPYAITALHPLAYLTFFTLANKNRALLGFYGAQHRPANIFLDPIY